MLRHQLPQRDPQLTNLFKTNHAWFLTDSTRWSLTEMGSWRGVASLQSCCGRPRTHTTSCCSGTRCSPRSTTTWFRHVYAQATCTGHMHMLGVYRSVYMYMGVVLLLLLLLLWLFVTSLLLPYTYTYIYIYNIYYIIFHRRRWRKPVCSSRVWKWLVRSTTGTTTSRSSWCVSVSYY